MFQNKSPSRDRDDSSQRQGPVVEDDEDDSSSLWLTTPLRESHRPPPPPAGAEEAVQTVFVLGTDEHQQIVPGVDYPHTAADLEEQEIAERRSVELEASEMLVQMVVRFRDDMAGLPRWSEAANERQVLLQRLLHDEERRVFSNSQVIADGRAEIEAEQEAARERLQLQQRLEQAGVRIAVGVVTDPMLPPDVTELSVQTDDVVVKELDEIEEEDHASSSNNKSDPFPYLALACRVGERERRLAERERRRRRTEQEVDQERRRPEQEQEQQQQQQQHQPSSSRSHLRVVHETGTAFLDRQAAEEEDFLRKTQDSFVLDNALRHVVKQCETELQQRHAQLEQMRAQVASSHYATLSANKLRGDIRQREQRIAELELRLEAAERQRAEDERLAADVAATLQSMDAARAQEAADAAVAAVLAATDAVIEDRLQTERQRQLQLEAENEELRLQREEEEAARAAERAAYLELHPAEDTEQDKGCTAHRAMLSPTPVQERHSRHVSPIPRRPSPPLYFTPGGDGDEAAADGDQFYASPAAASGGRTMSTTKGVINSPTFESTHCSSTGSNKSSTARGDDAAAVTGHSNDGYVPLSITPRAAAHAPPPPPSDSLAARIDQLNDAVARVERLVVLSSTPRSRQPLSSPAVLMSPSGPGSIAPTVTSATSPKSSVGPAADFDKPAVASATPRQADSAPPPPATSSSIRDASSSPSPSSPTIVEMSPLAAAGAALSSPVLSSPTEHDGDAEAEKKAEATARFEQPPPQPQSLPEWLGRVVAIDEERARSDAEADEHHDFVRIRRELQFAEVDTQVNRALLSVQRQHGVGEAALAAGTPFSPKKPQEQQQQQHDVVTPRPRASSVPAIAAQQPQQQQPIFTADSYTPSQSRAGSTPATQQQRRRSASAAAAAAPQSHHHHHHHHHVSAAEHAASVSLFGPSWSPTPFSFQNTAGSVSPPDNFGVRHVDPDFTSNSSVTVQLMAMRARQQQQHQQKQHATPQRRAPHSAARTLINNIRGSGGVQTGTAAQSMPFLSLAAAAAGAAPSHTAAAAAGVSSPDVVFACATGRCGFCSRCMFGTTGGASPGGASAAAAAASPPPPPPPTASAAAASSFFQPSAARLRHNKVKELLDHSLH